MRRKPRIKIISETEGIANPISALLAYEIEVLDVEHCT